MARVDGNGGPVTVGLVGAGAWAGMVHAPTFAAGPETALAGIWARRPAAAAALAARHGTRAFDRYEDLLDACEAVVFAVPPAAQPAFVHAAIARGKALLLEKPLATTLDEARRIADAVAADGVPSMLCLTYRFSAVVRSFLADAAGGGLFGGRGSFVTGALLGGPFAASPWRHEPDGLVLDLGPHTIDLMEQALGPVRAVRATGDASRVVTLLLEHDAATSSFALCGRAATEPRVRVEVYGGERCLDLDASREPAPEAFATLRREFAAVVRGGSHALDAAHGVHLQELVAQALRDLGS